MKSPYLLAALAVILTGSSAYADNTVQVSEPVKCYQMAWQSLEKGGLGLTSGQAVELCAGAKDAKKVIQCYAQAWVNPDNGGLGLMAGQAVTLCKSNPTQ